MRRRKLELVEQLEQAPHTDAVAVVAPGVVAMRLRLAGFRRVVSQACAEGEPLDVGGEEEGEPLAARPAVVFTFRQRNEVVAAVLRQERFQSTLAPEAFTTGPSFAISFAVADSNSSGGIAIGSAPMFCHTGCISAARTAFPNSALIRRTSARSIPFGPNTPE